MKRRLDEKQAQKESRSVGGEQNEEGKLAHRWCCPEQHVQYSTQYCTVNMNALCPHRACVSQQPLPEHSAPLT